MPPPPALWCPLCRLRMRSSTTVLATGSSPAVGSSYISTCSSLPSFSPRTTARASATRFCMPPDSCEGYRCSTPCRPTSARLSFTISAMRPCGRSVCSYSRNPTFSPTVSESNSAALWNTMPMLSRSGWSCLSDSSPMRGCPFTSTCPASGVSRPASRRSVVDFPVPEAPMTPTASPRRILKEQPRRIRLLPKALCTSRSSSSTSLSLLLSPPPLLLLFSSAARRLLLAAAPLSPPGGHPSAAAQARTRRRARGRRPPLAACRASEEANWEAAGRGGGVGSGGRRRGRYAS
mmetsp:Transcript_24339/g.63213  ORF Transcript_24339/g.63213 Transcript_24339/m.63213 type:complete len:291 (+) Transcript_24339:369-1241(+)